MRRALKALVDGGRYTWFWLLVMLTFDSYAAALHLQWLGLASFFPALLFGWNLAIYLKRED